MILDLNGLPQDCMRQTSLTADFGSEVPIWDEVHTKMVISKEFICTRRYSNFAFEQLNWRH